MKVSVGKEYEISAEIIDGDHIEKTAKIYVDFMQEPDLQRQHNYKIVIKDVYKHHIRIRDFEEIVKENKK